MSVDTKLFISSSHSLDDVKKVIESRFNVKVSIVATDSPSHQRFCFSLKTPTGDENRMLHVFTNYEVSGFHGTLLSLNKFGQANNILETLASVFGGFYQQEDSSLSWDQVTGRLSETDGIEYWSKHAVISKNISKEELDQIVKPIANH
jgi:hypothetical protein